MKPNTSVLIEGDRTELLCSYNGPVVYCRIEIPGEPSVLNLSPEWTQNEGFPYFGDGLKFGDCGVIIEKVKASNNGKVICSMGLQGKEVSGTIDLVVACKLKIVLLSKCEMWKIF